MKLKNCIMLFARHSGLLSLIFFLFRKRIPILMLHSVMDRDHADNWWPTWKRTSITELDGAIKQLSKTYQFLPIDTVTKIIKGELPSPSNSICLTFDDGYSNNISHAWPILKKHNAQMIIYVATKYAKERIAFWIDEVDYALHCLEGKNEVKITIRNEEFIFNLLDRKHTIASYARFRNKIKSLEFKDDYEMLFALKGIVKQLSNISGKSLQDILEEDLWSRPSKMEELRNLDDGILIGAHTVNHIRVTHVDNTHLQHELADSKKELEDATGKECLHFCYPNGDYCKTSAKAVEEAGYHSAVSCDEGSNLIGDNVFTLKRWSFPVLKEPKNIDIWLARELIMEWFSNTNN